MWYMGTHPWYDLFCDFMMKGNNVNDNGLAIDLMCYECMCCIVLTCRVQGLCDSRVCDASMTQYIAWRRALLPNTDTMTRTNKLDSSKVCFDRVYRPRMLRGMDVFHPMFLWYPRSWEGSAETRSPCCCDDDGRVPEVVGGPCWDTLPMLLWWRRSDAC